MQQILLHLRIATGQELKVRGRRPARCACRASLLELIGRSASDDSVLTLGVRPVGANRISAIPNLVGRRQVNPFAAVRAAVLSPSSACIQRLATASAGSHRHPTPLKRQRAASVMCSSCGDPSNPDYTLSLPPCRKRAVEKTRSRPSIGAKLVPPGILLPAMTRLRRVLADFFP